MSPLALFGILSFLLKDHEKHKEPTPPPADLDALIAQIMEQKGLSKNAPVWESEAQRIVRTRSPVSRQSSSGESLAAKVRRWL